MRTWLWIGIGIGSLLFAPLGYAKKKHRYYSLDPDEAEETLAGLAGRPRLLDNEWLSIVGSMRAETYTILPGDNLWKISKRLFGDAFLWRKLWEVNPFLSNPHELNAGDVLKYYADPSRGIASGDVIKVKLTKLFPPGRGKPDEIGTTSFAELKVKNRFRPTFVVLSPEDKVFGEITGAYSERDFLGVHEPIYIKPYDDFVFKPGERYAVAREERTLRDKTQVGSPVLGELVRHVGEIKILEIGEKLAKAELETVYGFVQRGDRLIALQRVVGIQDAVTPPEELQARIVQGEEADFKWFNQGATVLLNKGAVDGMKEGFLFRVFRETDLRTQKASDVEPESKGEVQIILVAPLSSVGYVARNLEPLQVGDTLIPKQAFNDPPPKPARSTTSFGLD